MPAVVIPISKGEKDVKDVVFLDLSAVWVRRREKSVCILHRDLRAEFDKKTCTKIKFQTHLIKVSRTSYIKYDYLPILQRQ